jgi:hypothetical protein
VLRSLSVVVVPLCAVALLSGCSPDTDTAMPSSSPAPVPADPSATDDVPGTLACKALIDAVRDGTLMTPGVVDGITQASSTADAPIADSAQRLAAAYAKAVSARGTDGEPDAVAAVSAAGVEMSTVCNESGLETVG